MAVNKRMVSFVAFILTTVFLLVTYNHANLFPHMSYIRGSPKRRYIFLDLGANAADSLEVFLKHENAKFQYDFPRPDWATYDQAEIYLFEANPYFNTALVQAKERYDALGINVNIFPSTVVDVNDGTRTFFLDTVNTDNSFWGSSTHASHPDAIKSESKGTELSAINISRWMLMNTLPHDFVVVKMDIEGAEYEVIPHMAEMKTWTVVDYLLIEWHPSAVDNFTEADAKVKTAMEKLRSEGVNAPKYDSPA